MHQYKIYFIISLIILFFTSMSSYSQELTEADYVHVESAELDDTLFIHRMASEILIKAKIDLDKKYPNDELKHNEELIKIKMLLGNIIFKFVKTKEFLLAKFKILLLKYPDLVVFDFLMRFIKYSVIMPLLYQNGFGLWLVPIEIIPEGLLFTGTFAFFRVWRNNNKISKELGQNVRELLSNYFKVEIDSKKIELNLNEYDLHEIMIGGKKVLIPIAQSSPLFEFDNSKKSLDSPLLSLTQLENQVDHQLLTRLVKLKLTPYNYTRALLEEILSDPVKKTHFSYIDKISPTLDFYVKIENLLVRLKESIKITNIPTPNNESESNDTIKSFLDMKDSFEIDFKIWVKELYWNIFILPKYIHELEIFKFEVLIESKKTGQLPKDAMVKFNNIKNSKHSSLNYFQSWISDPNWKFNIMSCKTLF